MYTSKTSPASQALQPSSNPLAILAPTTSEIRNLSARAKIIEYELHYAPKQLPKALSATPMQLLAQISAKQPPLALLIPNHVSVPDNDVQSVSSASSSSQESTPPSSTQYSSDDDEIADRDEHLAKLRSGRESLRSIISKFSNFFPVSSPEEHLLVFEVHINNQSLPEIHRASSIISRLFKDLAWLEDHTFETAEERCSFQREENAKMGRELNTLKTLIDSYVEIKEDLCRMHGITMSPIEFPACFEGYYGDYNGGNDYDDGNDYDGDCEEQDGSLGEGDDQAEVERNQDSATSPTIKDNIQPDVQKLADESAAMLADKTAAAMPANLNKAAIAEEAPMILLQQAEFSTAYLKTIAYSCITALAIGVAIGVWLKR